MGGDLSNQDAGGVLWRFDGSTWSVDPSIESLRPGRVPILNKVWGRSASDVYVCGRLGLVFHFDGTQWTGTAVDTEDVDPEQLPLFTIHGNATEVAAAGGFTVGLIDELVDGTFENRAPRTAPQMNGVFLAADGSGAAVGVGGTVALRGTGGWQLQDPAFATPLDLHGAWIDPDGGVWAVGGDLTTSLNQGLVLYGGTAPIE